MKNFKNPAKGVRLTRPEITELLDISDATIRRWERRGFFTRVKDKKSRGRSHQVTYEIEDIEALKRAHVKMKAALLRRTKSSS